LALRGAKFVTHSLASWRSVTDANLTAPFSIGVAESRYGGETFQKLSEAPVLGRNHHDPFLTGAPWVISENGRLRMWYISGTEWAPGTAEGEYPTHYYSIKHASSDDGMVWQNNDRLCLPCLDNEHAIARPVVTAVDGGYRMIYSARRLGETYRIYSATSKEACRGNATAFPCWMSRRRGGIPGWSAMAAGSIARTAISCCTMANAYGKDGFGAARVG
jgi:hypothetical protein